MPHIRPLESLSVQGLLVPKKESVLLKPVSKSKNIRDGFLRVYNVSNSPQYLMPSKRAQNQHKDFVPEIQGDDLPASLPMGWNNPSLRFEIISVNNSLLPCGSRVLNRIDTFMNLTNRLKIK